MIVEFIVDVFTSVVTWILDMLPGEPVAPDLAGFVETMLDNDVVFWVRGVVADWFPLDALVAALGLLVLWFVGLAAFRLIAWVLALVHVGGTEAA